MRDITLTELLHARERRQQTQQTLLAAHSLPLISFTMNIAGPRKRSRLGDLAFQAGVCAILQTLGQPLAQVIQLEETGCQGFFVYDQPALLLKETCIQLENRQPVGRLYDMDVVAVDGRPLARPQKRQCLCCQQPAAVCGRSRAHGLAAVEAATHQLLADFAAQYLADLAVQSLEEEAALTPKPGLVDQTSNGAHKDMDYPMFLRSAQALRPYFQQAVLLGMESADCMKALQQAGIAAEQAMFQQTGGVNTHKGALYALLLLLAGLGSCLVREDDLFVRAAALAKAGRPTPTGSHGARMVQQYGIRGARQEAEAGFPAAQTVYAHLEQSGGDAHGALMTAILQCDDTNLLYRGGKSGLQFARDWARQVLNAPQRRELLLQMDAAFTEKNLSPGGSADLLTQGLFLQKTQSIWRDAPPI